MKRIVSNEERVDQLLASGNTSREAILAVLNEARSAAIGEVADWISSSMASGLYGSSSWGLRRQIADVIKSRQWETTLKNEDMRP